MALSASLRYEVLRRCNFACIYCGVAAPVAVLHVDHVVPRSRGGSNDPWNLVAACQDCNLGKSDGVPDPEFVQRVADDYCAYYESRRGLIGQCRYCGIPISPECDDEPALDECLRCNAAVCDAYEEGFRNGRRMARN